MTHDNDQPRQPRLPTTQPHELPTAPKHTEGLGKERLEGESAGVVVGCLRVSEIVETRHACVGIKNDFLLYNPATVSELLEIVDHCRNHSKTFCFTFFVVVCVFDVLVAEITINHCRNHSKTFCFTFFVVVCVFDVLPYYECSNILAW